MTKAIILVLAFAFCASADLVDPCVLCETGCETSATINGQNLDFTVLGRLDVVSEKLFVITDHVLNESVTTKCYQGFFFNETVLSVTCAEESICEIHHMISTDNFHRTYEMTVESIILICISCVLGFLILATLGLFCKLHSKNNIITKLVGTREDTNEPV